MNEISKLKQVLHIIIKFMWNVKWIVHVVSKWIAPSFHFNWEEILDQAMESEYMIENWVCHSKHEHTPPCPAHRGRTRNNHLDCQQLDHSFHFHWEQIHTTRWDQSVGLSRLLQSTQRNLGQFCSHLKRKTIFLIKQLYPYVQCIWGAVTF